MPKSNNVTSQEVFDDLEDATYAELVGMVKRYREEIEQKDLEMTDLMKQVLSMSERLSALELTTTAPIQTTPVITCTQV